MREQNTSKRINDEIIKALPRLNRYAKSLTHRQSEWQDLVHEVICHALKYWNTYEDRNVPCIQWFAMIMRHQYSNLRKKENNSDLDAYGVLHDNRSLNDPNATLYVQEIVKQIQALPSIAQRQALLHFIAYETGESDIPLTLIEKSNYQRGRISLRLKLDATDTWALYHRNCAKESRKSFKEKHRKNILGRR